MLLRDSFICTILKIHPTGGTLESYPRQKLKLTSYDPVPKIGIALELVAELGYDMFGMSCSLMLAVWSRCVR
jgi:hypothetical protein